MNSIVEYDSAKLTKNNYPKRIISPPKLDLCCLSHTGAGMDSRIAMDTIVVTDIPRAYAHGWVSYGYPWGYYADPRWYYGYPYYYPYPLWYYGY